MVVVFIVILQRQQAGLGEIRGDWHYHRRWIGQLQLRPQGFIFGFQCRYSFTQSQHHRQIDGFPWFRRGGIHPGLNVQTCCLKQPIPFQLVFLP